MPTIRDTKIARLFRRALLLPALLTVLGPMAVSAATYSADEILNQFNLIVFENHKLNSQVHGRALVGGDVTGSGSMTTGNYTLPPSDFADVTIAGDITRNANVNTRGGASVDIGGANQGGINNAGSINTGVSGLQDVVAEFRSILTATSQAVRDLTPNASLTQHSQGVRFDGAPTDGRTVYSLSAADLTGNELDVILNGAGTILINVSGTSINLSQNFNTAEALGSNVLWNFYEAEELNLGNRFVGSVLAPFATLQNGNNIFGSVVVESFFQGGQIHQRPWQGELPTPAPVPLPATGMLLIGAVSGLALWGRRRAAAA